jgi:ABC-type Na+ transport system ATPase subunit NatA
LTIVVFSSVPITREMRSLINHLQAQCKLYNLEANRCKKQCKELEDELTKLKAKQEMILSNGLNTQISINTSEPTSAGSITTINQQDSPLIKDEPITPFASSTSTMIKNEIIHKEESTEGVCLFILNERFFFMLTFGCFFLFRMMIVG